jgi:hypothetical protein
VQSARKKVTITYPDGDIRSKRWYAALQRLFFRLSQTWNSAVVPATQLCHNQQCNRMIFPFKMQMIGPRLHKTTRGIAKTLGKPPGDCLVISWRHYFSRCTQRLDIRERYGLCICSCLRCA